MQIFLQEKTGDFQDVCPSYSKRNPYDHISGSMGAFHYLNDKCITWK